jgi:fucose permease
MIAGMLSPGRRLTFVAGTLLFLGIGAVQAMYGPAFASLQERFDIDLARIGFIVSVHFLGSFVTIALSGPLLAALGYRRLLGTAALLLAAGSLGVALSPSWELTLAAALVVGLGFGAVDVGMNLLFGRAFEGNSAPALNLLNAMFGVGALLGPLLIGLFGAAVRGPFAIVAGLFLLGALLSPGLLDPTPRRPQRGVGIPLGAISGFLALYFVYVTVEVGVASWEPTHLAPYVGDASAAFLTAMFWGAMALGRLAVVPISSRVSPGRLVLISSVVALAALLAAQIVPIAPWAYAVAGFAFGPIFPTGLAWLDKVMPKRSEQLVPIVIAGANLAPVITAPLLASAVAGTSSDTIPLILSGIALVLVVVVVGLWWRTR